MQMWEFLVFSPIDDETIGWQIVFPNQSLHGGEQVAQEGGILWIERLQGRDRLARDKDDMERVGWVWVMEGQQVFCLEQKFDGQGKGHF